jgi:hypothetical protein
LLDRSQAIAKMVVASLRDRPNPAVDGFIAAMRQANRHAAVTGAVPG